MTDSATEIVMSNCMRIGVLTYWPSSTLEFWWLIELELEVRNEFWLPVISLLVLGGTTFFADSFLVFTN